MNEYIANIIHLRKTYQTENNLEKVQKHQQSITGCDNKKENTKSISMLISMLILKILLNK